MTLEELQSSFDSWLSAAMCEPIPESVIAYNFNLAEAHHRFEADVIGASSYNPEDPDWACDEAFAPAQRFFSLPHTVIGTDWEKAHAVVCDFVRSYMQRHESPLSRATAVTVGFADGPLERVHESPPIP